jgi:ABC-type xylose transport system permease subunit
LPLAAGTAEPAGSVVMEKQRSRGARLTLLVIAVTLIGGGAAGLGSGTIMATKIGAVAAILAGLVFLRMCARSRS